MEGPQRKPTKCLRWGERRHRLPVYLAERYKPLQSDCRTRMRTNFDQLLEAGAHFGHLKRKWNPAMAPYIYMERNGIHIIDLNKTAIKIDEAAEALKNLARSGRKVLFVGTKKQAQEVVAAHAQEVAMPYITERWAGGMLTNFPTIRKAVKKMSQIDKMASDGTMDNMSKREKLQITRQREKLEKNLGSIADMTRKSPLQRLTVSEFLFSVSLIRTRTRTISISSSLLTMMQPRLSTSSSPLFATLSKRASRSAR